MFSDDPRLGFLAQRDRFQTALDGGTVLAPAKSLDEMQTVVTNATVNGFLAAFFGLLVVIVLLDATRVCIAAIRTQRAGGVVATTEVPAVRSQIPTPAGMFTRGPEHHEAAEPSASVRR